MFDDAQKEPEDIFAKTDEAAPSPVAPTDQPQPAPAAPAPQAAAPAPATPAAAPTPPPLAAQPAPQATAPELGDVLNDMSGRRGIPWKPIILVLGILLVIAAAFGISTKILSSNTPSTPEPPAQLDAVADTTPAPVVEVEPEPEPVVEVEPEPEPEPEVSTADSDKDGLTDAEEEELGTSSLSEDTDGDGLFDREEVITWKTNPLNPDTDGDGFTDGDEVSGGYNPTGPGTLTEIPVVE